MLSNPRSPWQGIRNAARSYFSTMRSCRRAQRYISGHSTTAMRPLGRYGTDVCLRHCLFLYPAGATGFLKAFQNAELPAYAVPCRRCLSEDVDIFQKSAERQGESGHDVRVSRLSTWMSTVGGPVMTRTTHHFSQKIHIRRPYIKTCVSHAPGVRRFCQYSLTLNFAIFTIKAENMSMVYKYYEKS